MLRMLRYFTRLIKNRARPFSVILQVERRGIHIISVCGILLRVELVYAFPFLALISLVNFQTHTYRRSNFIHVR